MTSATTGLPERYRALDQVGPDQPTPTGVIRCWRAKDRVLNRDVAIRVHTPGGEAARGWISRALTAGGLATPALAMVYDAAEGSGEHDDAGGAAYVVNEWIEGETLAERVERGPLPEREARVVVRRLAEGVAEAHRVGLAVGGLAPENVVLRPGGLVGLRSVPAPTGTMSGDIADLGALLELCLTGRTAGPDGAPPAIPQPDLAALVRRARSTEPSSGLASAAAMVSLLSDRPRTGTTGPQDPVTDGGPGPRRRRRDRPALDGTQALGAVLGADLADATRRPALPDGPAAAGPATAVVAVPAPVPPPGIDRRPPARPALPPPTSVDDLADDDLFPHHDDDLDDVPERSARRRLLVIGLPLLALALVVALGWWLGTNVLSVASSVSEPRGSTPSAVSSSAAASSSSAAPASATSATGAPLTVAAATVYDPFGDGESENRRQVPQSFDGNPATAWKTLNYRGSATFGNLKPGVGVVYDLGSPQTLSGVTLATTLPGSAVEVRVGDSPDGALDSFRVVSSTDSLAASTPLTFDQPVTTRYVLVWVTSLVQGPQGYAADLAEVTFTGAS